ncbi:MAG TPA: hypothetical protein VMJ65_03320 [Solirubrobacteraceae bacterium]|nr:hypothetical protein [Solirubrobacteraceae bacterium]
MTVAKRTVNARHRQLRYLAGGLIAASAAVGLAAVGVRAGWGGAPARALEGITLFLAAAAYVTHVLAHHETTRELLTRSILVSAFALWGLVQIAPGLPGVAVLNDVVIVLFVVDLAILVSPWL